MFTFENWRPVIVIISRFNLGFFYFSSCDVISFLTGYQAFRFECFRRYLDVRMSSIRCSKLSGASFLFAVFIKLRISHDSNWFSPKAKGKRFLLHQSLFVSSFNRKHDGNGLINHALCDWNSVIIKNTSIRSLLGFNQTKYTTGLKPQQFISVKVGTHLACIASVSVRFRNKEQGTRVKDRALVSFLARPKPKIPFLCLSLLSGHKYRKIKWIWICANRCGNKILLRKQRLQYTRNNFRWNGSRNMSPDLCTRSDLLPRHVAATCNL